LNVLVLDFTKPCLENTRGFGPQGDSPLFASFAKEVEEGRGTEANLALVQCPKFRDASAAVVEGQQQSMIASSAPLRPVGCSQQSVDLRSGQVSYKSDVRAFARDCHHTGDDTHAHRITERDEAEERADSSQPGIA
jgi:hypothetical protein